MGKLNVRYAPRRGTAENKRNSGFTLVEMLLIFPLAAALTGWQDGKSNCYWLKYDGLVYIHYKDDDARSYAQMSAPAFANTLGSAFTKPVETHPYWNTGVYPFPGLKDLPHYGDWPTF